MIYIFQNSGFSEKISQKVYGKVAYLGSFNFILVEVRR